MGAYRAALDYHIVGEIASATTTPSSGGQNAFEDVLYAQEAVRAAGYSPDLVVLSPSDALDIQLLQMSAGATYAFAQQMPNMVISTSVGDGDGFVCDTAAAGTLFLGPFTLAMFEEEAGQTNTSTVRAESSGIFVVQRPDAIANLAGGS